MGGAVASAGAHQTDTAVASGGSTPAAGGSSAVGGATPTSVPPASGGTVAVGTSGMGSAAGTGGAAGRGGTGTNASGGLAGNGGSGAAGSPASTWLTVDPAIVNIGPLDPETAGTFTLEVTNSGLATSGKIFMPFGPGLASSDSGCISQSLPPQASCSQRVSITQTSAGELNSWITVEANPGATPPLRVPVTGTIAPSGPFTVYPTYIALGYVSPGNPFSRSVKVTAHEPLTDLKVVLDGPDITLDSSSRCTAILAAGASCYIDITFKQAKPGSSLDHVVISAGGANLKKVTVGITGNTDPSW